MILFATKLRYTCVKVNKLIREEMRLPLLSVLGNFTHGERLRTKLVLCFSNKFIDEFLPNFVFNDEVAELPNAVIYIETELMVVHSWRNVLVENLAE